MQHCWAQVFVHGAADELPSYAAASSILVEAARHIRQHEHVDSTQRLHICEAAAAGEIQGATGYTTVNISMSISLILASWDRRGSGSGYTCTLSFGTLRHEPRS